MTRQANLLRVVQGTVAASVGDNSHVELLMDAVITGLLS